MNNAASLLNGATATVTIRGTVNGVGKLTNRASVVAADGSAQEKA